MIRTRTLESLFILVLIAVLAQLRTTSNPTSAPIYSLTANECAILQALVDETRATTHPRYTLAVARTVCEPDQLGVNHSYLHPSPLDLEWIKAARNGTRPQTPLLLLEANQLQGVTLLDVPVNEHGVVHNVNLPASYRVISFTRPIVHGTQAYVEMSQRPTVLSFDKGGWKRDR